MFRYGFELEGFYIGPFADEVLPPPEHYPADGFPGLVELRTKGGQSLEEAWAEIIKLSIDTPGVDFTRNVGKFSRDSHSVLRRRMHFKTQETIGNLYGKKPRLLGNKTIASCQLNISNLLQKDYVDKEGKYHLAQYGVLDVPKIVGALDYEFKCEIRASGRQPGEYAVKNDMRLEYRSLPNYVFPMDAHQAGSFLTRIRNAVGEKWHA